MEHLSGSAGSMYRPFLEVSNTLSHQPRPVAVSRQAGTVVGPGTKD